jgi:hypothetical protein
MKSGDNPDRVKQKVCQDIFISKLTDVDFLATQVVFKGGIVMHELTKGRRGYTKDIDFDLIHYPISEIGLQNFVKLLNSSNRFSNIRIALINTEELRHKNYHGMRVKLHFYDQRKTTFELDVDIGVHTDLFSNPILRSYEVKIGGGSVDILIDSNELSIVEKLVPFALFGTDNLRYRDVFDVFWRMKYLAYDMPTICQIFDDKLVYSGYFKTRILAVNWISKTLRDKRYINELKKETNWIGETIETICAFVIDFVETILIDA